jgi:hypothetical protein
LKIGFKDEIDGINQVGKQKTCSNKGTCQPKPSQICDVLGKFLDSLEKIGIQLGKEFFREYIETSYSEFRAA